MSSRILFLAQPVGVLDGVGTVIPLSGGRYFVGKFIFHVFQSYFVAGKTDSRTIVKKLAFILVLREIVWGNISAMTVGSFQVFINKCNFDMCVACQSPSFLEHIIFHFLCSNYLFLFGGQTCEGFIFSEYRI